MVNLFFPVFPPQTEKDSQKPGKNYGELYFKREKDPKIWCVKLKLNNVG